MLFYKLLAREQNYNKEVPYNLYNIFILFN